MAEQLDLMEALAELEAIRHVLVLVPGPGSEIHYEARQTLVARRAELAGQIWGFAVGEALR